MHASSLHLPGMFRLDLGHQYQHSTHELFFSVIFRFIDRNIFETTEKRQVISVRMSENIGQ